MPIAVDAMGGDHAPGAVVEGAVLAAREHGVHVILVGDRDVLHQHLRQRGAAGLPVSIRHASEVVGMHESPATAVRGKRDSSLRRAVELVKDGEARGFVSAGNSGAAMGLAMLTLRLLPGVERPAFAAPLPSLGGTTLLLDAGANVSCKPLHLVQFALMGEAYSRRVLGVVRPRVGVLANGEEDSKGTELTRGVHRALGHADLEYAGYVEGRDIFLGGVDVVVTDGFTGNAVLKASEGLVQAAAAMLREELGRGAAGRLGYLLSRGALQRLRRRTDYTEVGGAPVLGINGVGIVAHGSSDPRAVKNAIRVAREFADRRVNLHLLRELEASRDLAAWTSPRERPFWSQLKERIVPHRREEGDGGAG